MNQEAAILLRGRTIYSTHAHRTSRKRRTQAPEHEMNAPKKPLVQIRRGSEKLPAKPSSPQPAGIDFQTGVVRSVSSWMRMTKINMEGENSGESDYARAEREQTKLQLHNITKRLCEVLVFKYSVYLMNFFCVS